jgi:hypothetical protein
VHVGGISRIDDLWYLAGRHETDRRRIRLDATGDMNSYYEVGGGAVGQAGNIQHLGLNIQHQVIKRMQYWIGESDTMATVFLPP